MLVHWIKTITSQLAQEVPPRLEPPLHLLADPSVFSNLLYYIARMKAPSSERQHNEYSACWFIFDSCIAQLQYACERHPKLGQKLLQQSMATLTHTIRGSKHSFNFWLPALNAFYETRLPLSPDLQHTFYILSEGSDEPPTAADNAENMVVQSIQEVIQELHGSSDCEIAEHFFSQSYAMPPSFFMDLLPDFYHTDSGQDIGLLFLLHPNPHVRQVTLHTLDQLMPHLQLSATSLSRLNLMIQWAPLTWLSFLTRWMKLQRRNTILFFSARRPVLPKLWATEIDGSGTQLLLLQFPHDKGYQLAGLLLHASQGIKEAWINDPTDLQALRGYLNEMKQDQVYLKPVSLAYVQRMLSHCLETLRLKNMLPPLRFIEIHDRLAMTFEPQLLEISAGIQELGVQILPFTATQIESSLAHSAQWCRTKEFTQSWFDESADIDACVNQHSYFEHGEKRCDLTETLSHLSRTVFEQNRQKWAFHFLWTALWAQAASRPHACFWKDALIIAYLLEEGAPLEDLPILKDMIRLSIIHSLRTMENRQTHLSLS